MMAGHPKVDLVVTGWQIARRRKLANDLVCSLVCQLLLENQLLVFSLVVAAPVKLVYGSGVRIIDAKNAIDHVVLWQEARRAAIFVCALRRVGEDHLVEVEDLLLRAGDVAQTNDR